MVPRRSKGIFYFRIDGFLSKCKQYSSKEFVGWFYFFNLAFQDSKSDWKEFYSWKPRQEPKATKLDGIKVDVSWKII